MKRTYKSTGYAILFFFVFFVINSSIVSAQDELIGKVIPTGDGGSIKSKNLSSLIKKVQPLFVDSMLSTEDHGQLTFVLNDGSIVELAKSTRVKTAGKLKNYKLDVEQGEVAYKVAKGSTLTINTPTAEVVVPYDQTPTFSDDPLMKDPTIGLVSYDGQKTTVFTERGEVKVTDLVNNTGPVKVASGERFDVEGKEVMVAEEEPQEPEPAAAEIVEPEEPVQEVARADSTKVYSRSTGMSTTTKILLGVGGALLVGGAIYALTSGSNDGGGPVASPSVP